MLRTIAPSTEFEGLNWALFQRQKKTLLKRNFFFNERNKKECFLWREILDRILADIHFAIE